MESRPQNKPLLDWTVDCANSTHKSSLFPLTQRGKLPPILGHPTQPRGCCEVISAVTEQKGHRPESPHLGLLVTTGKTLFTFVTLKFHHSRSEEDGMILPLWTFCEGPRVSSCLSPRCSSCALRPHNIKCLPTFGVQQHPSAGLSPRQKKNKLFSPTKKPILLQ